MELRRDQHHLALNRRDHLYREELVYSQRREQDADLYAEEEDLYEDRRRRLLHRRGSSPDPYARVLDPDQQGLDYYERVPDPCRRLPKQNPNGRDSSEDLYEDQDPYTRVPDPCGRQIDRVLDDRARRRPYTRVTAPHSDLEVSDPDPSARVALLERPDVDSDRRYSDFYAREWERNVHESRIESLDRDRPSVAWRHYSRGTVHSKQKRNDGRQSHFSGQEYGSSQERRTARYGHRTAEIDAESDYRREDATYEPDISYSRKYNDMDRNDEESYGDSDSSVRFLASQSGQDYARRKDVLRTSNDSPDNEKSPVYSHHETSSKNFEQWQKESDQTYSEHLSSRNTNKGRLMDKSKDEDFSYPLLRQESLQSSQRHRSLARKTLLDLPHKVPPESFMNQEEQANWTLEDNMNLEIRKMPVVVASRPCKLGASSSVSAFGRESQPVLDVPACGKSSSDRHLKAKHRMSSEILDDDIDLRLSGVGVDDNFIEDFDAGKVDVNRQIRTRTGLLPTPPHAGESLGYNKQLHQHLPVRKKGLLGTPPFSEPSVAAPTAQDELASPHASESQGYDKQLQQHLPVRKKGLLDTPPLREPSVAAAMIEDELTSQFQYEVSAETVLSPVPWSAEGDSPVVTTTYHSTGLLPTPTQSPVHISPEPTSLPKSLQARRGPSHSECYAVDLQERNIPVHNLPVSSSDPSETSAEIEPTIRDKSPEPTSMPKCLQARIGPSHLKSYGADSPETNITVHNSSSSDPCETSTKVEPSKNNLPPVSNAEHVSERDEMLELLNAQEISRVPTNLQAERDEMLSFLNDYTAVDSSVRAAMPVSRSQIGRGLPADESVLADRNVNIIEKLPPDLIQALMTQMSSAGTISQTLDVVQALGLKETSCQVPGDSNLPSEIQMLHNIKLQLELTKTLESMQKTMQSLQVKIKQSHQSKQESDTSIIQANIVSSSVDTDSHDGATVVGMNENEKLEEEAVSYAEEKNDEGESEEAADVLPQTDNGESIRNCGESVQKVECEEKESSEQGAENINNSTLRESDSGNMSAVRIAPEAEATSKVEYKTYKEWRLAKERMRKYFEEQQNKLQASSSVQVSRTGGTEIRKEVHRRCDSSDNINMSKNDQAEHLDGSDNASVPPKDEAENLEERKNQQIRTDTAHVKPDALLEEADQRLVVDSLQAAEKLASNTDSSGERQQVSDNFKQTVFESNFQKESKRDRKESDKHDRDYSRRDRSLSSERSGSYRSSHKSHKERNREYSDNKHHSRKSESSHHHHRREYRSSSSQSKESHSHEQKHRKMHKTHRSSRHEGREERYRSRHGSRERHRSRHGSRERHRSRHGSRERHRSNTSENSLAEIEEDQNKNESPEIKRNLEAKNNGSESEEIVDVVGIESETEAKEEKEIVEIKRNASPKNLFEKLQMETGSAELCDAENSEEQKVRDAVTELPVKAPEFPLKAPNTTKKLVVRLVDVCLNKSGIVEMRKKQTDEGTNMQSSLKTSSSRQDTGMVKKSFERSEENIFEKMLLDVSETKRPQCPAFVDKIPLNKGELARRQKTKKQQDQQTIKISDDSSSDSEEIFAKINDILNGNKKKKLHYGLPAGEQGALKGKDLKGKSANKRRESFITSDSHTSENEMSITPALKSKNEPKISVLNKKKEELVKHLRYVNESLYWKNHRLKFPCIKIHRLSNKTVEKWTKRNKSEGVYKNFVKDSQIHERKKTYEQTITHLTSEGDWRKKFSQNLFLKKTGLSPDVIVIKQDWFQESSKSGEMEPVKVVHVDKRKAEHVTYGEKEHIAQKAGPISPIVGEEKVRRVESCVEMHDLESVGKSTTVEMNTMPSDVPTSSDMMDVESLEIENLDDLECSLGSDDNTSFVMESPVPEKEVSEVGSDDRSDVIGIKDDKTTDGDNKTIRAQITSGSHVANDEKIIDIKDVIESDKVTSKFKDPTQIELAKEVCEGKKLQELTETINEKQKHVDSHPVIKGKKQTESLEPASEGQKQMEFTGFLNEGQKQKESNSTVTEGQGSNGCNRKESAVQECMESDSALACSVAAGNIFKQKYDDSSSSSFEEEPVDRRGTSARKLKRKHFGTSSIEKLHKSPESKSPMQDGKTGSTRKRLFKSRSPFKSKMVIPQFDGNADLALGPPDESSGEEGDVEDNISFINIESDGEDSASQDLFADIPERLKKMVPTTSPNIPSFSVEHSEKKTNSVTIADEQPSTSSIRRDVNYQKDEENAFDSDATKSSQGDETDNPEIKETDNQEIKEEPDWLKNGYTQEPDTIFVDSDSDDMIMISTPPPILVSDDDETDTSAVQTTETLTNIKVENNDMLLLGGSKGFSIDTLFSDDGFSSAEHWSDEGSDFEPEDVFKNAAKNRITALKEDMDHSDSSDVSSVDLFKTQNSFKEKTKVAKVVSTDFDSSDDLIKSVSDEELLEEIKPLQENRIQVFRQEAAQDGSVDKTVESDSETSSQIKEIENENVSKDHIHSKFESSDEDSADDEILCTSAFDTSYKVKKLKRSEPETVVRTATSKKVFPQQTDVNMDMQRNPSPEKNEVPDMTAGRLVRRISSDGSYEEMVPYMKDTQVDEHVEPKKSNLDAPEIHSKHFPETLDGNQNSEAGGDVNDLQANEDFSGDSDIMIIDNLVTTDNDKEFIHHTEEKESIKNCSLDHVYIQETQAISSGKKENYVTQSVSLSVDSDSSNALYACATQAVTEPGSSAAKKKLTRKELRGKLMLARKSIILPKRECSSGDRNSLDQVKEKTVQPLKSIILPESTKIQESRLSSGREIEKLVDGVKRSKSSKNHLSSYATAVDTEDAAVESKNVAVVSRNHTAETVYNAEETKDSLTGMFEVQTQVHKFKEQVFSDISEDSFSDADPQKEAYILQTSARQSVKQKQFTKRLGILHADFPTSSESGQSDINSTSVMGSVKTEKGQKADSVLNKSPYFAHTQVETQNDELDDMQEINLTYEDTKEAERSPYFAQTVAVLSESQDNEREYDKLTQRSSEVFAENKTGSDTYLMATQIASKSRNKNEFDLMTQVETRSGEAEKDSVIGEYFALTQKDQAERTTYNDISSKAVPNTNVFDGMTQEIAYERKIEEDGQSEYEIFTQIEKRKEKMFQDIGAAISDISDNDPYQTDTQVDLPAVEEQYNNDDIYDMATQVEINMYKDGSSNSESEYQIDAVEEDVITKITPVKDLVKDKRGDDTVEVSAGKSILKRSISGISTEKTVRFEHDENSSAPKKSRTEIPNSRLSHGTRQLVPVLSRLKTLAGTGMLVVGGKTHKSLDKTYDVLATDSNSEIEQMDASKQDLWSLKKNGISTIENTKPPTKRLVPVLSRLTPSAENTTLAKGYSGNSISKISNVGASDSNSEIELIDASKRDMWLSKKSKPTEKTKPQAKLGKRKRKEDPGEILRARVQAAKVQIKQRARHNLTHPEAYHRAKVAPPVPGPLEQEDVTLPTDSQIIREGLPVLNPTGLLLKGSSHSVPTSQQKSITEAEKKELAQKEDTAEGSSRNEERHERTSEKQLPKGHSHVKHSKGKPERHDRDNDSVKEKKSSEHQISDKTKQGEKHKKMDTHKRHDGKGDGKNEVRIAKITDDRKDGSLKGGTGVSKHGSNTAGKERHRSSSGSSKHKHASTRDKSADSVRSRPGSSNSKASSLSHQEHFKSDSSGHREKEKSKIESIRKFESGTENVWNSDNKVGERRLSGTADVNNINTRSDIGGVSDKVRKTVNDKAILGEFDKTVVKETAVMRTGNSVAAKDMGKDINITKGSSSSSKSWTFVHENAKISNVPTSTQRLKLDNRSRGFVRESIHKTRPVEGKENVIGIRQNQTPTSSAASRAGTLGLGSTTSTRRASVPGRPNLSEHITSSVLLQKQSSGPSTRPAAPSATLGPPSHIPQRQPFQPVAANIPSNLVPPDTHLRWNNFLRAILRWNPNWFQEREKMEESHRSVEPPPDIVKELFVQNRPALYPLVERYENFKDYSEKFMMPLLLYETWESCYSTWREKKRKRRLCSHKLMFMQLAPTEDKITEYTLIGLISETDKRTGNYVVEGDLVKMKIHGILKIDDKRKEESWQTMIGFVEKVTFGDLSLKRICNHYKEMDEIRQQLKNPVSIKLQVKIRQRQFTPGHQCIDLQGISTIINTKREFVGLAHLPRSLLCKDLLFPTANITYCDHAPPTALSLEAKYNMSQSKAINTAVKIALLPPDQPRVCLLQGPPGTGKSHTIIGIIQQIVRMSKGKCRICLCAPSNAAIDELLKRIVKLNEKLDSSSRIKIVRLGKNVHPDIQRYGLDQLVQKNIDKSRSEAQMKQLPIQTLQEARKSLKKKIQAVRDKLSATEDQYQKRKLSSDLSKLEKEKQQLEQKLFGALPKVAATPQQEGETRTNVLLHSHVIAGTLSSMGSNVLRATFREPGKVAFNVVIIDEATQAVELDTLIPLQYGVSKLIMVGDPEQLPPTVLSQVAMDNKFNLSLFERLNSFFKYSPVNPVILLDTQYRMDPEIAAFPNNYIYDKMIKNDECVTNRSCPLEPYLLFDIAEGREVFSQGCRSMSNPMEAIFTAELCKFIVKNSRFKSEHIGIIAPYAKQKSEILQQLRDLQLEIDVSTVDGFQGQEKHIIIMSCVRANATGAVGFVGSRNRMNVSLTRAKYAMYLIGNFDSLQSSDEWKALIEDARERKKIVHQSSVDRAVSRVIRRQT